MRKPNSFSVLLGCIKKENENLCIHGNFQTAVWQFLEDRLKAEISDLDMVCEDLYAKQFEGFDGWTEDFCNRVESEGNGEKSILLGYSLGGRLALHACVRRPDLWKAVVVAGADPGLESEEDKRFQLERDRNWAERLKSEPLEKLADEWDEQPVFCGLENRSSSESGWMDANKLSRQFEVFSKGPSTKPSPRISRTERARRFCSCPGEGSEVSKDW